MQSLPALFSHAVIAQGAPIEHGTAHLMSHRSPCKAALQASPILLVNSTLATQLSSSLPSISNTLP
ncbi:MAG: hypothetical protein ACFB5Z_02400 [Elainellaceae cyanobacterium]